MKVIIVGCGRTGSLLADKLSKEGNEVTIIDKSLKAFEHLSCTANINMVYGTGIDEDVLIGAGIKDADSFFALTKGDNTNIMIAQIAHSIYKVPKVFAKIVDSRSRDFFESEFGFTCYCPPEVSEKYYSEMLKGAL